MIAPARPWVQVPSELAEDFGSRIGLIPHRLAELPLFSDSGLLEILRNHPRELANVSRMGPDHCRYDWAEGETAHLSPEDLLEAVRRGRLWLNIRQVMKHQPELRSLIEECYEDLESQCPGFESFRHSGNLLISSPSAFVYYHLDVPPNMLWHIRGRKRVWVYPCGEPLMTREVLEQTVAGERIEDLPYEPEFDRYAQVYDLEPGQLCVWPQHSPHRVQNLEGLNVSLSTEHYTEAALKRIRVMEANCFFRRWFKLPMNSAETESLASGLKRGLFLGVKAFRRIAGQSQTQYDYPRDFRVDLNAPDCISPVGK